MGVEQEWQWSMLAKRVIEALRERQIEGSFHASPEGARDYVLGRIQAGSVVGYGGSRTLIELGIIDALRQADLHLLDRGRPGLPAAAKAEYEERACRADVFLSGINAVSLDGRLVFIDCYGNRVAPILFGPRRVILVAGANKIEPDLPSALRRAKEVAAPRNAFRLQRGTPCTETGQCQDCRHASRICSYTAIIDRAPQPGRIEVVLVGASLGL